MVAKRKTAKKKAVKVVEPEEVSVYEPEPNLQDEIHVEELRNLYKVVREETTGTYLATLVEADGCDTGVQFQISKEGTLEAVDIDELESFGYPPEMVTDLFYEDVVKLCRQLLGLDRTEKPPEATEKAPQEDNGEQGSYAGVQFILRPLAATERPAVKGQKWQLVCTKPSGRQVRFAYTEKPKRAEVYKTLKEL